MIFLKRFTTVFVFFCLLLSGPRGLFASAPMNAEDAVFLDQLEKAAFHGFEKLLDPITGFPVDGAPVSQGNVVRLSRSVRFNKTSPAHLALAFFYHLMAGERGWIPKNEAYRNLTELLDNMDALETFKGFLFQWYSISGRPEEWPRVTVNRFIPVYENALLDSALMCAAGAYPGTGLARSVDRVLAKKDYGFFYDRNVSQPGTKLLTQGFDAAGETYADRDYALFSEPSRLAVLIAVLKDGVPEEAWKNQKRLVRVYEKQNGQSQGVLASWSGGLAEALFADEILGGDRLAPRAFRANARAMIDIHQDKGRRLSESGIWGFSSGEVPDQGRYDPMGVAEVAYQRSGAAEFAAPYGVLLALRYEPEETLKNLRAMKTKNPAVFGPRYGFADTLDPVTGEVNRNILALDKGVEFMALANFQSVQAGGKDTAAFLWAYFKKRGWEKRALDLLKSEEALAQYAALEPGGLAALPQASQAAKMDLLATSRDIGTFYDPERSKAAYRMIEKEGREPSIGLRYDVSRPAAYSGLYVKLKASDFSSYRTFHFRVKGSPGRGYPSRMKVEIKNRGQNVQFAQISPSLDWQDIQIPLPRFLAEVDEVAFVFDNAESGKNRRGEILLDNLYFN